MAVFTDLSEADCGRIATAYRLGSLTSVIGIADGDAETTYLFRSARGEFIVTLFESEADPFDLEGAFRTMETLSGAGIPCPATFRTDAGAATITVSDKLVAVVGFVPGSRLSEVTPGKCHALGSCVARIHETLRRSTTRASLGLPKGPVHGALNRDNVFFLDEMVSGVINFRLRHDDVLIAELAEVIVHWAVAADGTLERTLVSALLAGYDDIRSLSEAEWRAVPAFVMAAAATMFAQNDRLADLEAATQRVFLSAKDCIQDIRP
ncbi:MULTISPECIES: phosphotransferase [unclassified Rhizobium]|uniref:phosphotransferase n=1 Tax=unclassified Rhizobium TaxID=2613769 RepID=UPI0007EBB5CA|nr:MULTISPECIES: phosphotransferase [unclassified Rhizobium]ANM12198.1 aminoglycoside phosphotransferase protein [Rhizobium sp. N324]ANM18601.1 aminoglycoside phosphotransferase protein [Rhizobium sp. N541]ANM24987.1 aminoglycoside phosphotransferase protein [Rhizobium sp. N941]OYD05716.1 aminoglycoside phosphotransferase protein [Rhizobium sp. N4311]